MIAWDKLEAALADVQNILGEMWDALPASKSVRVGLALKSAEDLARQVAKLKGEDEPRDEAYERAASRFDGSTKDWR
jgi:hypothetical protein